jgi:hypothetical protein
MSDLTNIKEIYINVDLGVQTTSQNLTIVRRGRVRLWRMQQVIFRAHLKLDADTYWTTDTGTEWACNMDYRFGEYDDPVASDNDQFNIGDDWPGVVSPENGKICWRSYLNTTELADAMGTDDRKDFLAELWVKPPGEDFRVLAQLNIDMRNISTDISTTTPLTYTLSSALAFDGDDVVLYYPDGSVAQRWTKT